jgi:hypothetical protein
MKQLTSDQLQYRRNCLVPVPEAQDLAALNAQLLAACVANRDRTISGKSMTVGEASQYERAFLLPRADEGFPLKEVLYPLVVDGKGRVRVKVNWYSAPLPPGLRLQIRHDHQVGARHPRCYGRGHEILNRSITWMCRRGAVGDGGFDALAAVATGGSLARVHGPDLAAVGAAPRQKVPERGR